jgi:superfamily II DNA/RNA helicase
MPKSIRQLAQKILHNPVEISLAISTPADGVDQKAYLIFEEQKAKMVKHILAERKHYDSILIFTSTKSKISDIVRSLNRNGFPSTGISSNLEQDKREEVLRDFRSRKIRILVATDVMSRGIDVREINLVINYDVPHDAEDYVHRVGRTARVNEKGEGITLVTQREMYKVRKIEHLIKAIIPKLQPPGEIGPVPEWKDKERMRRSSSERNGGLKSNNKGKVYRKNRFTKS